MDSIFPFNKDSITLDTVVDGAVQFLNGAHVWSLECQCFFMALQGAMQIRQGPNANGKMHWFHAFCYSCLAGYAGGWFGFLWMGKPSSMLSNDLNMASCIMAFILVNYTPFDLGFKLCSTMPVKIITVVFAQLFRSTAIPKFVNVCFEAFKNQPSAYYPIPVFGPILYATLLGNMGGFIMKGLEGHVQNGVPWPVQNGLFVASFYHFYVNDLTGPIGQALRWSHVPSKILPILGTYPSNVYAGAAVSFFMLLTGVIQMPEFCGPAYTPFGPRILSPVMDSATWLIGHDPASAYRQLDQKQQQQQQQQHPTSAAVLPSKTKQRSTPTSALNGSTMTTTTAKEEEQKPVTTNSSIKPKRKNGGRRRVVSNKEKST